MKFAVVLLALLPLTFGASIDEKRVFKGPLGGYDILDLAKQIVAQFAIEEMEIQCETNFCPQLLDSLDVHNPMFTSLCCTLVCNEAKILASQYLTTMTPPPMPPSK